MSSRPLPASTEAEQFVLGSVLLDPAVYTDVAARLAPDDFLLERHQTLLAAMAAVADAGRPIDRLTLAEHLRDSGRLAAVGGLAYLAELTDGLPVTTNIAAYLDIVADKSARRRLLAASQAIDAAARDESTPVDEVTAHAERLVQSVSAGRRAGHAPRTARDFLEQLPGKLDAFLHPERSAGGLPLPWPSLEPFVGGLQPGELVLLAGRPAMGKTAAGLQLADFVAAGDAPDAAPRPALYVSLEMPQIQLERRRLCRRARVDQARFRRGLVNEDERRRLRAAVHDLAHSPLHTLDTSQPVTTLEITRHARRLRDRPAEKGGPLALLVVDYIQLMTQAKAENRVQEVSILSRDLKRLAMELEIPVVALSQVSRKCEDRGADKRPLLSDLRESGSLEQDADRVLFIYREEVYKPDRDDLHGLAEMIVAKNRNGPTGRVKLAWLERWAAFETLAEDREELIA